MQNFVLFLARMCLWSACLMCISVHNELPCHMAHAHAKCNSQGEISYSQVSRPLCRNYAFLFHQFLHSKLQCTASHSRRKPAFTSTAEVAAPAVTPQFSCKASANTDYCQHAALQVEVQWKSKQRPPTKSAKSDVKQSFLQQSHDGQQEAHSCCSSWLLMPTVPLPWQCSNSMPSPATVYSYKQHVFYGRGADSTNSKTDKDEKHSSTDTQGTLQIKGSSGRKPKPTWQLRIQKAVSRKLQLRGQASAQITPLSLLPAAWQLEARRKLPRGASMLAKLQQEEGRQAAGSRHRLMIERKSRDAWWTSTCTCDSAGWPLSTMGVTAL